jgi:hypothetical protein
MSVIECRKLIAFDSTRPDITFRKGPEPSYQNKQNNMEPSVTLNTTFEHTIQDITFDVLDYDTLIGIFKDGRVFSHFIERWLPMHYPIVHVPGCKDHDHTDKTHIEILYDAKSFTKGGCKFLPSNMIGTGRVFDAEVFQQKCSKLIYCVVSNINFPRIKVRFIRGVDLATQYPSGKIPLKDFDKLFD